MEEKQRNQDLHRLREWLPELPEPVAKPVLIVVSGLPGTGKSYFSHRLRERLDCAIVESDNLRKFLFPSPSYDAQENYRVFQACHALIEQLLRRGTHVILDATNLVERHRERLYNIADRNQVKLIIVRVKAPPELVHQRLESRLDGVNRDDHSDADWTIYQKMKPKVEKIRRNHFVVDTSQDITPFIEKILKEVKRQ